MRQILVGSTQDVSWSIDLEERSYEEFLTVARVDHRGRRHESAVHGPKLWPGQPVIMSTDLFEGLPRLVVLVRTSADVSDVQALSDGGRYVEVKSDCGPPYEVPLSAVDVASGLRFGLALLGANEGLWDLSATLADGTSWSFVGARHGV